MRSLRIMIAVALTVALAAVPGLAHEGHEELEEVTLYLHGTEQAGELEYPNLDWFHMDASAPEGDPKSMGITNYVAGPNFNCSGNWLLPTWQGFLNGTITGDITVVLHTAAVPWTQVDVELYADAGGGCNEEYAPPVLEQTVQLAAGQAETTVTFTDVEVPVTFDLVLMVNATQSTVGPRDLADPGSQGRILYDSPSALSRVEFNCLPPVINAETGEHAESCLF